MFVFKKHDPKPSNCFFTHCEIPEKLHEKNVPVKKQPFSTIRQRPFIHTLNLILPDEIYAIVAQNLDSHDFLPQYARVQMSLLDILSGEFFNQYIKIRNILMRSEGRDGVDHMFTLSEGLLRIEVDTPTYERCGLPGKPIRHEGRKHVKARYAIEYDLRHPSMLHGKKGFERLVWTSKNVLNRKMTWLFLDLNATGELKGPVTQFQPDIKTIQPEHMAVGTCTVPIVDEKEVIAGTEYEEQLLEWLGLVLLNSPRVNINDAVDPYLCRYELPEAAQGKEEDQAASCKLHHLRWRGFMSSRFITSVLLAIKEDAGKDWFVMNVSTFGGSAYTLICRNGKEILLWDVGAS